MNSFIVLSDAKASRLMIVIEEQCGTVDKVFDSGVRVPSSIANVFPLLFTPLLHLTIEQVQWMTKIMQSVPIRETPACSYTPRRPFILLLLEVPGCLAEFKKKNKK